MTKHILTLILGVALLQSAGCALLSRPAVSSYGVIHSYDGVSASYSGTALAQQTVDELLRHYPPGRTSLILVKAPGSFGENLEAALRQQGFSVVSPDAATSAAGVTLGYQLDEVAGENTCYLQVSASDGVRFGFVKSLAALAQQDVTAENFSSPSSIDVSHLPTPAMSELAGEPAYTQIVAEVSSTPRTMPLRQAVLHQLPSQWRYTIPDVGYREVLVSQPDRKSTWRANIRAAAEQAGCAASFDENARRVTIIAYDDAPLPQESQTATSAPSAPIPVPFSQATPLPLSPSPSAVVATALHDVADQASPMTKPDTMTIVESKPSAEQWDVVPGSLFTQLISWCDRADYQLIWKASHDLDMEAHAIFRGSFTEAIDRLFKGLHKSGNPLRVTLYTANSVMEISEE